MDDQCRWEALRIEKLYLISKVKKEYLTYINYPRMENNIFEVPFKENSMKGIH